MRSNRARRTEPYRVGDRVVITPNYSGAVGPSIHGRAGAVHKVVYPPKKGGKIIWVRLDGEPVTSVVLCFADELDREPDYSDDVYHDSLTQEQRVTAWAEDPEGKELVSNILQRKAVTEAARVPGPLYHSRPGRTYLPREEGTE